MTSETKTRFLQCKTAEKKKETTKRQKKHTHTKGQASLMTKTLSIIVFLIHQVASNLAVRRIISCSVTY